MYAWLLFTGSEIWSRPDVETWLCMDAIHFHWLSFKMEFRRAQGPARWRRSSSHPARALQDFAINHARHVEHVKSCQFPALSLCPSR